MKNITNEKYNSLIQSDKWFWNKRITVRYPSKPDCRSFYGGFRFLDYFCSSLFWLYPFFYFLPFFRFFDIFCIPCLQFLLHSGLFLKSCWFRFWSASIRIEYCYSPDGVRKGFMKDWANPQFSGTYTEYGILLPFLYYK